MTIVSPVKILLQLSLPVYFSFAFTEILMHMLSSDSTFDVEFVTKTVNMEVLSVSELNKFYELILL